MLNYLRNNPDAAEGGGLNDLCASFQDSVCSVLAAKTEAALLATGVKRLVVSGGVACNRGLRRAMEKMAGRTGVELHFPSPLLCTDNAAMLAVPGDFYLTRGITGGTELDAITVWPLDDLAKRLA